MNDQEMEDQNQQQQQPQQQEPRSDSNESKISEFSSATESSDEPIVQQKKRKEKKRKEKKRMTQEESVLRAKSDLGQCGVDVNKIKFCVSSGRGEVVQMYFDPKKVKVPEKKWSLAKGTDIFPSGIFHPYGKIFYQYFYYEDQPRKFYQILGGC